MTSHTVFDKGLLTALAACVLFALIAAPLAARRIPPNFFYGYRTRATLRDRSIWYEANAHFGRGLLLASAAGAGAVLVLRYLAPSIPADLFFELSLAAFVLPPLVATIATARYVHRLVRPQPPSATSG